MTDPYSKTEASRPADARCVLVLQGGGALGSYQVGAFEGLCSCEIVPQWVAGISIGAINAALIAGNPPERRHQRLAEFWTKASSQVALPEVAWLSDPQARSAIEDWNAGAIMVAGVPGFFKPRFPPLPFQLSHDLTKLSFYDTSPLLTTLRTLVDFDLINSEQGMRISVGAVDVRTGAQVYFDNKGDMPTVFKPEHIMASAALPPGFPAIRIGDDYYWDGGLTSNTPLDHVLKHKGQDNLLIFQLDLFSAAGVLPTSLGEIAEREKDIRFASRTEINTSKNKTLYNAGKPLPRSGRAVAHSGISDGAPQGTVTVIHLTYHSALPEVASRDYNFSPVAIEEHRDAGKRDIARAMNHPDWLMQPQNGSTMVVYELTQDNDEPVKRM